MTPVLFLDFDGPLFPENFIPHSRPMRDYPGASLHQYITYWEMSQTSVRQLNALYDIFPFDTIVSSSWKHYVSKEQVEELFAANHLKLHLHKDMWATPERMSSYRVNDISWAVDELQKENEDGEIFAPAHIILDVPWSGSYLENWKEFGLQEPVLVDPNVGISHEDWRTMYATVRGWAEDYKSQQYQRIKKNYRMNYVQES